MTSDHKLDIVLRVGVGGILSTSARFVLTIRRHRQRVLIPLPKIAVKISIFFVVFLNVIILFTILFSTQIKEVES